MPRPQRCRVVCSEPRFTSFSPDCGKSGDVLLSVDEFEAIRLIDYEKKTHEQSSVVMEISRTTVTEIYETARYKIADAIVNGKKLVISGGNYQMCSRRFNACSHKPCFRSGVSSIIIGDKNMKIAVTYDNGQIFQHFGHTENFKFYEVENGKIVKSEVVGTNGEGHSSLGQFLKENNVNLLICGGIGSGAQEMLKEAGIELCAGVHGLADDAVASYLKGELKFVKDANCDHHHHSDHDCHTHNCKH